MYKHVQEPFWPAFDGFGFDCDELPDLSVGRKGESSQIMAYTTIHNYYRY